MSNYLVLARGRWLQTPVYRLRHSGTGRRVTLVGVMHCGLPEYYQQLGTLIADLEAAGTLILAAVPLRPDEGERPVLDERQQALLERMRSLGRRESAQEARLGWIHQGDGLPEPDSWQRVNTTPEEDIVLAGDAIAVGLDAHEKLLEIAELAPNLGRINRAVTLRRETQASTVQMTTAAPIVQRCDERARTAVHATKRDTLMLWGAKHLPVLLTDLTTHGYEQIDPPVWYTAVRLPSIWAAIGRMLIFRKPRDLSHLAVPARSAATPTAAVPQSPIQSGRECDEVLR